MKWAAERRSVSLWPMLAAEIWYWWIGVILLIVSVAAGLALVVGYLKTVSSQNYPDAEQSRQADL